MKSTSDIVRRLQELKPALAEKYKVKEIGLFGSFATGEQTDASGIDILIDLHEPLGWEFF